MFRRVLSDVPSRPFERSNPKYSTSLAPAATLPNSFYLYAHRSVYLSHRNIGHDAQRICQGMFTCKAQAPIDP